METREIIKQVVNLPIEDKLLLLERTLHSIREVNLKEKMSRAVSELYEEYTINRELTVFTEIDFENFYEAR
jgi:Cdc6-like AAA superfamily ATPase